MRLPFRSHVPVAGLVLVLAAAAALFPGCSKVQAPENVVFITLDTFRADHLGVLSGGRAATPVLDGLAARGILYENAWSPIPITLPAHKSIFYGRPPHVLETYNNGQITASRRDTPSFVQAFRKKGFDTAGFVSLGVLTREYGTAEGFDHYDDRFPDERWYLTAEEVNRRVIPWLEARGGKPFFLWVHYSDPHDPYAPPDMPEDLALRINGRPAASLRLNDYARHAVELDLKAGENVLVFEVRNPFQSNPDRPAARLDEIRLRPGPETAGVSWEPGGRWISFPGKTARFFKDGATIVLRAPSARKVTMEFFGQLFLPIPATRTQYAREVEYLDGKIGELLAVLDRLGLRDSTAVIAVGDHGEGLGEFANEAGEPHCGHIKFLEKVYLHVPLIIALPGDRRAGTRRTEPVTLLDIAPTFRTLFGLDGLRDLPGRDLLSLPEGASIPVFAETYRPESDRNRFALYDGPWQMILNPELGRHRMYNLSDNPAETKDLWDTEAVPPAVRIDFEKRLGDFARRILSEKTDASIDPKAEEMLRSLGYIGN